MTHDIPSYDPSIWRVPVLNFSSIAEFKKCQLPNDAIVSIGDGKGRLDIKIERLLSESADGLGYFLVCLSATVSNREQLTAPIFFGVGLASQLGLPLVSIADPVISQNRNIRLAWYAGQSGHFDLPKRIANIIDHISRETKLTPIILGGSGGGFACINIIQHVKVDALGLSINPQTAICNYEEGAVRQYISVAIPNAESDAPVRDILDRAKVHYDVRHVGLKKSSLLVYLQNASDGHVEQHMRPFIQSGGVWSTPDQATFYSEDRRVFVHMGNWGLGHVAPSREVIQETINCMIAARSAERPFDELVLSVPKSLAKIKLPPPPADISFEAKAVLAEGSVSIRVHLKESTPDTTFAFYLLEDGVRAATKWYSKDNVATFATNLTNPNRIKIAVFVKIADQSPAIRTIPVDLTPGSTTPSQIRRRPQRIAIYGSCVSADAIYHRDEFELVEYIARSSLASQVSGGAIVQDVIDSVPSEFQKKMILGDMTKSLWKLLESDGFDLLLIDFIDERFSVARLPDASLLTLSSEFMFGAQKAQFSLEQASILNSESDEKWSLWKKGWDNLYIKMKASNRLSKLIVNRVFYADRDALGHPIDGAPFDRQNSELSRFYKYIEEKSPEVQFLDYPRDIFLSDPNHKWGMAPFHYWNQFYDFTVKRIMSMSQ